MASLAQSPMMRTFARGTLFWSNQVAPPFLRLCAEHWGRRGQACVTERSFLRKAAAVRCIWAPLMSRVVKRGASAGKSEALLRNFINEATGHRLLFGIYGNTTWWVRSPNWMVLEFLMVRIIPRVVSVMSLLNTDLGPVILPIRKRPKKAVRVAAQNRRSGRAFRLSWL